MKPYKKIQKIFMNKDDILEVVLTPRIYMYFRQTYLSSNNFPKFIPDKIIFVSG